MNVGVIGSGSIGPDLAYGFVSALAKGEGGTVYLLDIQPGGARRGRERIQGYVDKGLARGKLSPKVAAAIEGGLVPTLELEDLADCDYVLEAATEDLADQAGDPREARGGRAPRLPDRLRHLGHPARADRRRGQAPGALLRQPPVLPGLARAARSRSCSPDDEALRARACSTR